MQRRMRSLRLLEVSMHLRHHHKIWIIAETVSGVIKVTFRAEHVSAALSDKERLMMEVSELKLEMEALKAQNREAAANCIEQESRCHSDEAEFE